MSYIFPPGFFYCSSLNHHRFPVILPGNWTYTFPLSYNYKWQCLTCSRESNTDGDATVMNTTPAYVSLSQRLSFPGV